MKVLVTGASGYLAGHCVRELQANGYEVRGTVRSAHKSDVRHLGDVEIVEADLGDDAGWDKAVRGCDHVWHVASPFLARLPKDENELIVPAVEGTKRVLRAAAKDGNVRRIVLTSSAAAIKYGHDDPDRVFTEDDWTVVERTDAYPKSKTLAERAAWELAASTGLELAVVNPTNIVGPLLHAERRPSLELILRMMNGRLPAVPRVGWANVDVRDLARLHRLAMETPEAAGNRYIGAGPFMWAGEMAAILAAHYGPRGYRITTRPMPYWVMWTIARFDPGVRLGLNFWGHSEIASTEKAHRQFGWATRDPEATVLDAAESMIRFGLVKPSTRRR